ncbi:MAG: hypothetical protein KA105_03340 [Caulobacter sp.]|nr:hypothetical protein [Caulobacter sp.]
MTTVTLKTFFCDDAGSPIYASCEAAAAEVAVEAALKSVPKPVRARLAESVRAALDEVFHVRLDEVLSGSWKKLTGVQDALDATRLEPGKVVLLPLLEHKISSRHQPHIEVKLGPKAVSRLVFDLVLALDLKSVELEVREGRIAGLRSGQCGGNGVFSFEGQDLIKKTTPAFSLPGRVSFSHADD